MKMLSTVFLKRMNTYKIRQVALKFLDQLSYLYPSCVLFTIERMNIKPLDKQIYPYILNNKGRQIMTDTFLPSPSSREYAIFISSSQLPCRLIPVD